MSKSKKQKIVESIEAKGLVIESCEWQPISKGGIMCGAEGGWTIFIDEEKSPLRGVSNPILGYNYEEVLEMIKLARKGIDFCPMCGIGISRQEEAMRFCEECRTDFDDIRN